MKRWTAEISFLIGGLAAFAAAGAAALLYTQTGDYDVAASKQHTKLTAWITHRTMIHSVRRHARRIAAPATFRPAQVAAGFCLYERHCVACHGAPAVARQPWVFGMTPGPPYLVDAAKQWSPAELFWITKHGLKMTGMPAWLMRLPDRQIWDLVAFLEAMPKLPPRTYLQWRAGGGCRAGPAIRWPAAA